MDELDPLAFGNWDAVPAPAQDARAGQVLIHNHPGDDLTPSDADISVASMYGKSGVGFYIIDNACARVRVVVKPFVEKRLVPVDAARLRDFFGPEGGLARAIEGYEHRPQQVEMMGLVARALNEDRIAMVEAGTGTGKSFAYLAPAIEWAVANKQRVVVSTNTINLQEQLLDKDIPALRARLGTEFKAVLLKGRGNYVSLRRLEFAVRDKGFLEDERGRELRQLSAWAKKTRDGSKSDIAFELSDDAWEAAQSDKDDCLRARCPHFDECFYYRSRREAAAAEIVVANHHLVMADVALKRDMTGNDFTAILPPFDRVVFDEAHNLEEVATDYFSSEVSPLAIRRQLGKLRSHRDQRGALARLRDAVHRLDSSMLYPPTKQILNLCDGEIGSARVTLDDTIDRHFDEIFYRTLQHFGLETLKPREKREVRVTREVAATEYWREVEERLEAVAVALAGFLKPLEKVAGLPRFYPEETAAELVNERLGVVGIAGKLAEHLASVRFFIKAGDEDYCRWVEVGYFNERPAPRLCVAPLDTAPALRSALFARKRTAVLTSATLAVEKQFDFFARRLGLAPPPEDSPAAKTDAKNPLADIGSRTDFLLLGSPFDYAANCLVGVALDMPPPARAEFDEESHRAILGALRITGGRAFVLFTSFRALDRASTALSGPLAREGITVLRQGSMPRTKLLDAFRSAPRAALFATSSFWEGVDVQGRALECLVLCKLPFRVPTTPLLEARTERIDRLGGDSFHELSVPLAVIRFKQEFGRLIRSKTDRGVVLILDPRVATKAYGKSFLRSLPAAEVVADHTESVLARFAEFLTGERGAPPSAGARRARQAGVPLRAQPHGRFAPGQPAHGAARAP